MKKLIMLVGLAATVACNNSGKDNNTGKTITKDTTASIDTIQSAPQQNKKGQLARLNSSISMSIYEKGFNRIGTHDYTRFNISITNKSDQTIIGVKGRFVVSNLFGDHLKNYNLKYDDTNIKPGQSLKIIRYWDYDKTSKQDSKIRTTSLSKLVINYEPEMVLFSNGSKLQL